MDEPSIDATEGTKSGAYATPRRPPAKMLRPPKNEPCSAIALGCPKRLPTETFGMPPGALTLSALWVFLKESGA